MAPQPHLVNLFDIAVETQAAARAVLDAVVADLGDTAAFGHRVIVDLNVLSGHDNHARHIYPPNRSMRLLHRHVLVWLRSLGVQLPHATGGQTGNSPLKNVQRHATSRHFYLTDLSGAFESLLAWRLATVLCQLDPRFAYSQELLEQFLTRFCCIEGGGLATGSPSSTLLFNIGAGVMLDRDLGRYCADRGLIYSRYIDDITVSTAADIGPEAWREIRRSIRVLIAGAGFTVNHRKSQVLDLTKGTIVINGIGLELGGRTFVPRPYLVHLRRLLNRALKHGDISPAVVYGHMGVFFSCIDHRSHAQMNAAERKVHTMYQLWHHRRKAQMARARKRRATLAA